MIPDTQFDLFLYRLDFPSIPDTLSFTLGGIPSIGGYDFLGEGQMATVLAWDGIATQSSAPVPTAKILQGGSVGTAYSETISAQGGSAPYTFSVTAGSLPAGLALNASTGVISGTPTTVQTANFTIQATDANGLTGETDFEIGVTNASSGGAKVYAFVA